MQSICINLFLSSILKNTLSIVCLFLIGCLSVSVFSPEIHSSLFHGGDHCTHDKNGNPCPSHNKESSDDRGESCAVVLFGESSEHFFTFLNSNNTFLLDLGISNFDYEKKYFSNRIRNCGARGPPCLI